VLLLPRQQPEREPSWSDCRRAAAPANVGQRVNDCVVAYLCTACALITMQVLRCPSVPGHCTLHPRKLEHVASIPHRPRLSPHCHAAPLRSPYCQRHHSMNIGQPGLLVDWQLFWAVQAFKRCASASSYKFRTPGCRHVKDIDAANVALYVPVCATPMCLGLHFYLSPASPRPDVTPVSWL
jgi:hypothetical protein